MKSDWIQIKRDRWIRRSWICDIEIVYRPESYTPWMARMWGTAEEAEYVWVEFDSREAADNFVKGVIGDE